MTTEQTLTSSPTSITRLIATPAARRMLRETLYLGAFLAVSVYAWVRLLFHDMPFNLFEETLLVLRILFAGVVFAAICVGGFNGIVYTLENYRSLYSRLARVKWQLAKTFSLLMLVSVLFACSGGQVSINKDITTGMITTGRGMQVGAAKIIKNEEVLNEPEVPLGESFYIVNEGIKGLTVKDGKVSISCSLLITDKKGNVVLSEADLFKDNNVFDKDKVESLRCIVNTGKPMQIKGKYQVSVVFSDRYGKGSVENKLDIRTTEME